ncbi:hypothetical protein Fmac_031555 [Flemingia macrophylla]|uniref:Phytocyanin domain-containing protein n=1 Tax=Flemingia macrophylla TaxID=520843 RepID=A0ABD1L2E4_9FABA
MASSIALVLGVCLGINMAMPTLAAVHTVGDSSGWTIGADYGTWASSFNFKVGDSLVFNYGAGHTVDEVKESDYKSCTTGNSLSTDSSGATTIALKSAGTHYFICGVPGHCKGGMKLAVKVKGKKAAAAPAAAPSPAKASPEDVTDTKNTPSPTTSSSTTSTTPSTTSTSTTATSSNTSSSPTSRLSIIAMFVASFISCILV